MLKKATDSRVLGRYETRLTLLVKLPYKWVWSMCWAAAAFPYHDYAACIHFIACTKANWVGVFHAQLMKTRGSSKRWPEPKIADTRSMWAQWRQNANYFIIPAEELLICYEISKLCPQTIYIHREDLAFDAKDPKLDLGYNGSVYFKRLFRC